MEPISNKGADAEAALSALIETLGNPVLLKAA
jgi:hypothetical protein